MTNIVEFRPQPRPVNPPPYQSTCVECVGYELAAIHEGVPIALLVSALNRRGLTVSNVRGHGLVIHRIGQDPRRPAIPFPVGAS